MMSSDDSASSLHSPKATQDYARINGNNYDYTRTQHNMYADHPIPIINIEAVWKYEHVQELMLQRDIVSAHLQ